MKQYFAKMKEPGKVLRQSQIDGMTVTVTAALAEIDKNRLVFEITAFDEQGQMARENTSGSSWTPQPSCRMPTGIATPSRTS